MEQKDKKMPATSSHAQPKISSTHLQPLEKRINTDRAAVKKKKPMKINLKHERGAIKVELRKALRELARVRVGGKDYVRSFSGGNPASESLVRHNLESLVIDTKAMIKHHLAKGTFTASSFEEKNTFADIMGMMMDYDGILSRQLKPQEGSAEHAYFTLGGKKLGPGKALSYALGQFFKDELFVRKILNDALEEFRAAKD
jgi:hypothetical protein